MFTYWKGYEIDGSSTTYNIVLPKRELISEMFRYLIQLNIIDRKTNIHISYSERQVNSLGYIYCGNEDYKPDEMDKICELLKRSDIEHFEISLSCIHPEKLYHELRKELYDLSKIRPGGKELICNYHKTTTSPLSNGPALMIYFDIRFYEEDYEPLEDYEPEGLVFNSKTLISNIKGEHFTVNFECGPVFIFEYAAYITSKIAERFPEIGIDGGIDCEGGFTEGCTYSHNLFKYERITFATENIALAISTLLSSGLILPQQRGGKYGNEIFPCEQLYLFNLYNADRWENGSLDNKIKAIKEITSGEIEYTPEEYECFVNKVSKVEVIERIDFMHYCACCVKIDDHTCALTCKKEDGRIYLELRILPEIRDDIEKKLRSYGISVL